MPTWPTSASAAAPQAGAAVEEAGMAAATVLGNILRGLPKEECYERWCKIATAHDPAWPFTGRDFERHYRSAARKAEQIRAEEQQVRAQWLGRLPGGIR